MLEIGKMNPDSINVGRNDDSKAAWKATCCVSANVEITSPVPSAPTMNSDNASRSENQFPRMGNWNRTIAASTISAADASEIRKYGMVLPTTNENVSIGAIRTCSIVPTSFSRTIEMAVEMTAVIIRMYAISPGTRNSVLRSSGLYQMRGSTDTGGAALTAPGANDAPALRMMFVA